MLLNEAVAAPLRPHPPTPGEVDGGPDDEQVNPPETEELVVGKIRTLQNRRDQRLCAQNQAPVVGERKGPVSLRPQCVGRSDGRKISQAQRYRPVDGRWDQ